MKNSEVLFKVADYIEEHGFRVGTSGWVWEDNGKVCFEGAFLAVLGLPSYKVGQPGSLARLTMDRHPAYRALQEHVNWDGDLCEWNDIHGQCVVDQAVRECAVKQAIKEDELVT